MLLPPPTGPSGTLCPTLLHQPLLMASLLLAGDARCRCCRCSAMAARHMTSRTPHTLTLLEAGLRVTVLLLGTEARVTGAAFLPSTLASCFKRQQPCASGEEAALGTAEREEMRGEAACVADMQAVFGVVTLLLSPLCGSAAKPVEPPLLSSRIGWAGAPAAVVAV